MQLVVSTQNWSVHNVTKNADAASRVIATSDIRYIGSLQVVLHAVYSPIVVAIIHDFNLSIMPSQGRGLFLHSNLSRRSNV